jgi:hypothetical protein
MQLYLRSPIRLDDVVLSHKEKTYLTSYIRACESDLLILKQMGDFHEIWSDCHIS